MVDAKNGNGHRPDGLEALDALLNPKLGIPTGPFEKLATEQLHAKVEQLEHDLRRERSSSESLYTSVAYLQQKLEKALKENQAARGLMAIIIEEGQVALDREKLAIDTAIMLLGLCIKHEVPLPIRGQDSDLDLIRFKRKQRKRRLRIGARVEGED